MEDNHLDSVIVLSDLSDSDEESVSLARTAEVNNKKICEIDARSDFGDYVSFVETTEVSNKNMREIDTMSDSGDSVSFVETEELNNKKSHKIDALSDSSFEFPEVNFHYQKGNKESQKKLKENDIDSIFSSCGSNTSPIYDVDELDSGISGSGSTFSCGSQNSDINIIMQKYAILKRAESSFEKKKTKPKTRKAVDPEKERLNKEKLVEKERLKAERQKKKDEQAKEQALKVLANKNYKKLKPEECIKSMKIMINEDIQNCAYFADIIKTLQEAELSFNIGSQFIPQSVFWKRQTEEYFMDEKGEICTRKDLLDEDQIIIIWNCEEAVKKVANGTFCKSVESICDLLPQKRLTLVIYGITDYFLYHKNQKDKAVRNEILGNEKPKKGFSKNDKLYGVLPKISRKDLELCLTEIQILNNCSNRIVKSAEELALVVYQYTKAISEIPFKEEKRRNMEDKVSWYAAGDNRDTVKVDKDGNGLKRLWQQQLCQFNLSSLETAEAICQVYGSPLQLIEVRITFDFNDRIHDFFNYLTNFSRFLIQLFLNQFTSKL